MTISGKVTKIELSESRIRITVDFTDYSGYMVFDDDGSKTFNVGDTVEVNVTHATQTTTQGE